MWLALFLFGCSSSSGGSSSPMDAMDGATDTAGDDATDMGVGEEVGADLPEEGDVPPAAAECASYAAPTNEGPVPAALDEISGLVVSRRNPGVLWVHNDSGDTARVVALSDEGALLGQYTLDGVVANDWEDLAQGPCPTAPDKHCIWVADTGNNALNRQELVLYAFEEPDVEGAFASQTMSSFWTLPIRYPQDTIDCEALVIDPATGTPYLFEKVTGLSFRVFKHPGNFDGSVQTLERIAVVPSAGVLPMVTAADWHPTKPWIAVRTYTQSHEYRLTSADLTAMETVAPTVVAVGGDEPQGEAISYGADGESIWTVSERRNDVEPVLHHYECQAQ